MQYATATTDTGWVGAPISARFEGWYLLGPNQFPIDPAMVGPGDNGAMYLVGGDPSSLYRTYFYPNASFLSSTWTGWGAFGGTSLSGTPGLGLGADGRAYLAYRWPLDGSYLQGTTWMYKFSTAYAEPGWYIGPTNLGPMTGTPSVVVNPSDNRVYVLARRPSDNRHFYGWASQGTGNTWYTYWYDTGGVLANADLGVASNGPLVAGLDGGGNVWWWSAGANVGWIYSANGAVGNVASTPDLLAAFGPAEVAVVQPGSCPDPPVVTKGGPDVSCTGVLDAPNYNHNQFSAIVPCRITPADSAVTVNITSQTFGSITMRFRATASAQIATHRVECLARESGVDHWYPLWKNLQVTGSGCTPTVSGIQVNNQSTNTIIQGVPSSLRITGTCFTGTTTVRIGSTPLSAISVQGDSLITATSPSNPGGTGNQTLSVVAQQTGTSNVFVTQLSIKQVSFKTSLGISRDLAGPFVYLPAAPSPPLWSSSSSSADPIAFVRGSVLTVDAVITASPVPSSSVPGVRIEGMIPGIGKIVRNQVTIAGGTADTTVSDVASSGGVFPTLTRYLNPLVVNWSISPSGSDCGSCADIGSSSNEAYVLLAQPASQAYLPFGAGGVGLCLPLTVLRLGVGAGGASNEVEALTLTWQKFTPLIPGVSGWDGRLFYYYGTAGGVPAGFNNCASGIGALPALVFSQSGSGQCTAFAQLLRAALAINGIYSEITRVTPIIVREGTLLGLMVIKHWGFPPSAEEGYFYPTYPSEPYLLTLNDGDSMYPPRSDFGDLTSLPGSAGQNMTTPGEKVFGLHWILRVPVAPGDKYYDGSYGVTYADETDFEIKAIAGYAFETLPAFGPGEKGYRVYRPSTASAGNVVFQFDPQF